MRWTSKSIAKLTAGLRGLGHVVRDSTVRLQVMALGYSLQANRKTREGADHPDRDAQFQHIATVTGAALAANQPVLSIDTKKKELIGDYKNGGRELARSGEPVEVNTHDFPDKELGKAVPYGIYDVGRNEGWVSVGTVPSYCTSCSPRLGFDVTGVRDAGAEFLLDVGPERNREPSGGAVSGLQLAVADPVVNGAA